MPMVFLCTALIFGAALVGTEGFQRTPLRSFKGISYDSSSTKLEALRSKETNNFYPFSNAFESSSSSSSLARSKQSTTTKPGSTTSTALEAVISEVSPLEKGPGMTETPGFWRFIILIVTILWATNFSVIKEIYAAVPGLDAPFYSAVRMTIGAAVLAPAALKRISNTEMAWQSVGVGFVISLGYVGQGIGLETSTSDKGASLIIFRPKHTIFLIFRPKHTHVNTFLSQTTSFISHTTFIRPKFAFPSHCLSQIIFIYPHPSSSCVSLCYAGSMGSIS